MKFNQNGPATHEAPVRRPPGQPRWKQWDLGAQVATANRALDEANDLAELDQELEQSTVEGESNLIEVVVRWIERARTLESFSAANKARAKDHGAVARAQKDDAEAIMARLAGGLGKLRLNARNLKTLLGTVSLVPGRLSLRLAEDVATSGATLDDVERSGVPASYWTSRTVYDLDRAALVADLEAGKSVPGATLLQAPPHIRVSTPKTHTGKEA